MAEAAITQEELALRGNDLACATLDYIRDHQEEWNQNDYFCGTTACFAGHALVLAGAVRAGKVNGRPLYSEIESGDFNEFEKAMVLLGWTFGQAAHVFYNPTKRFGNLEMAVKAVISGAVQ